MKMLNEDLWLCEDCIMPAVYGDFTGLDYYYSPDESSEKQAIISEGLDKLGTICITDDVEEFSHKTCDCCNTRLGGKRYNFAQLGE